MPEKAPPSAQWWERQRRWQRRAQRGPFQARHCLNSACSNLPPCHPAREQILDHLEVVIVKNAVQNRKSEALIYQGPRVNTARFWKSRTIAPTRSASSSQASWRQERFTDCIHYSDTCSLCMPPEAGRIVS